MNEDTPRGNHEEHELERAMVKNLARHEAAIRERAQRRLAALVAPEQKVDPTGFCEGGRI